MRINEVLFEKILANEHITKTNYANYAQIPYSTVTGWKKTKQVPPYAMVILKDMIHRKKLDANAREELQRKNKRTGVIKCTLTLSSAEIKRVEAAFWGTNYTADEIIEKVKEKNPRFVAQLKRNATPKLYKKIESF